MTEEWIKLVKKRTLCSYYRIRGNITIIRRTIGGFMPTRKEYIESLALKHYRLPHINIREVLNDAFDAGYILGIDQREQLVPISVPKWTSGGRQ